MRVFHKRRRNNLHKNWAIKVGLFSTKGSSNPSKPKFSEMLRIVISNPNADTHYLHDVSPFPEQVSDFSGIEDLPAFPIKSRFHTKKQTKRFP